MKRLNCGGVNICSKTYTANSKRSIDSILNNSKAEESFDHELAYKVFIGLNYGFLVYANILKVSYP